MTAVVFDPAAFKLRYPQFAAVSDSLLGMYFDEATLYLSNSDCSPVQNIARRTMLLWMLTAHIAVLNGAGTPAGAAGGPTPVGRASSGTEGSVSASLEYAVPGTAAWFAQTQYGAAFWQATISLRSFRYIPEPTRY